MGLKMEFGFLTELSERAMATHTPMSGQFELTPVCNLNCAMCYIHRPEEDRDRSARLLPASFWIQQAQQAVQAGMLVLSLTGGETLLYPELDTLMDALMQLGILISFNTNGTLIDEKRVEWFLKYPPAKINISLYGASDATYAKLCGMKDGFTRVSRGIELLQAAGLNVYLNGVMVPENRHDLPQMHAWAKAHGLDLHTTSYIFPPKGRAGCASCELHRFSAQDAAQVSCEYSLLDNGEAEFKQQAANTIAMLDMLREHGRRPGFRQCRAGACSFAITWDGKLRPCVMFESLAESLEDGFAPAWDRLTAAIRERRVPVKCYTCESMEICPVCLAAIYQETAAEDTVPQYLCDYTEAFEQTLRQAAEGVAPTQMGSASFKADGCNDG